MKKIKFIVSVFLILIIAAFIWPSYTGDDFYGYGCLEAIKEVFGD